MEVWVLQLVVESPVQNQACLHEQKQVLQVSRAAEPVSVIGQEQMEEEFEAFQQVDVALELVVLAA